MPALTDETDAWRRDRAELERSKLAAEAANAAKTRYLVAVSHEIRSPLNAILGYAQLLERPGTIDVGEAGGVIRRSAEHLADLVEGMLDISRIESGTVKLRQDIVRLPLLLDHIVDMFRMQAVAKGLTLDYRVDGTLPAFVRIDEKRFRQILINLLSNAIKYTEAGRATLTVRYRSQMAQIDIADTGIGIAPEDLERIFEPFERGGSADAALQPGIGLGLAITRLLAGILGGEVTVSSELGRGSRFRLRMMLPEPMTPPTAAPVDEEIAGYEGERRTILVIDDSPSQLVVMKHFLAPLGFQLLTAASGAEGLALAEGCTPDLVLLDLQMPGLGGWDVAAKLRARFGPSLQIVILSANVHEYRAGGDGRSDHNAFLSKPVDLDALLDTIGRLLDLRWIASDDVAKPERSATSPSPAILPAAAGRHLAGLKRSVKLGHVRAIEVGLADLEADVPESISAVAEFRRLLDAFDLRTLARRLDDVE